MTKFEVILVLIALLIPVVIGCILVMSENKNDANKAEENEEEALRNLLLELRKILKPTFDRIATIVENKILNDTDNEHSYTLSLWKELKADFGKDVECDGYDALSLMRCLLDMLVLRFKEDEYKFELRNPSISNISFMRLGDPDIIEVINAACSANKERTNYRFALTISW